MADENAVPFNDEMLEKAWEGDEEIGQKKRRGKEGR